MDIPPPSQGISKKMDEAPKRWTAEVEAKGTRIAKIMTTALDQ
jgi:hypothetical protein